MSTNGFKVSAIPVVDFSTTDETATGVRKVAKLQREHGAGAEGNEMVKFVGLARLGWSYDEAVAEGVMDQVKGHYSKGLQVAGWLECIATGDVPERYQSDAKRPKFEAAVERVKDEWARQANEVRERGGEFPSLTETALGLWGEDGDARGKACRDFYGVLGGIGTAYATSQAPRVQPEADDESGDDAGEDAGESGNDDDPVAKLKAMATTMRQYADKHGVKHGDVLAIVTAAFK